MMGLHALNTPPRFSGLSFQEGLEQGLGKTPYGTITATATRYQAQFDQPPNDRFDCVVTPAKDPIDSEPMVGINITDRQGQLPPKRIQSWLSEPDSLFKKALAYMRKPA